MNAILQPQFFKRSTCHSATFYPVQLPHILEFEKKERKKKVFVFLFNRPKHLNNQHFNTV